MAVGRFGAVVGIEESKENKEENRVYRVVIAQYNQNTDGQTEWQFSCRKMTESDLVSTMVNGAQYINVSLSNSGKLEWRSGAASRFNSNKRHRPYVIISQILNNDDRIIGFKVADFDGNVKNIKEKEMIAYGYRMTKFGDTPVQNAMFVPSDEKTGKKAFYKAYPGSKLFKEKLVVNKNKYNKQAKKPDINKNKEALSKLEQIYTPEQIKQLKEGKAQGVDIKIYANPALSAEQMKWLKFGLTKGADVRCVAFPEFKLDAMQYYVCELIDGMDIKKYLNTEYNAEQIAELSLAVEEGLDISNMANPKNSASDMAEIRERLEYNIWNDMLVTKDGSWK